MTFELDGMPHVPPDYTDFEAMHREPGGAYAEACRQIKALTAEVGRLRESLIACARGAGADVSGGVPTSPPVDEWAVQQVRQLREDYREAGGG